MVGNEVDRDMLVRASDGVHLGIVTHVEASGAVTVSDRVDEAVHLKYSEAEVLRLWQHEG